MIRTRMNLCQECHREKEGEADFCWIHLSCELCRQPRLSPFRFCVVHKCPNPECGNMSRCRQHNCIKCGAKKEMDSLFCQKCRCPGCLNFRSNKRPGGICDRC